MSSKADVNWFTLDDVFAATCSPLRRTNRWMPASWETSSCHYYYYPMPLAPFIARWRRTPQLLCRLTLLLRSLANSHH